MIHYGDCLEHPLRPWQRDLFAADDWEALLAEFDGSVCPACHCRAHEPGACSECPHCELHTDEALAFVLRYEPGLLAVCHRTPDPDALAVALLVPTSPDLTIPLILAILVVVVLVVSRLVG